MILVVCWFELQVMWLSIDLRFKWFGCQLIWDSSDLVVNRFEIQMSWLSIDLRFKWFGCQMIWGSSDLVVNWCVIQMILSNAAFLRDFLQNWSFEAPKRNISARLPSKMKLWNSKPKHFCETSFKIAALKLQNEAFLRDFLSKLKLRSSKTNLFCENSFKIEALKLKNEAFLRDFLQNWSFETQKRSISARLPSKMKLWSSKTKLFRETSFKNDMSTRHLTSELVLTIFNWMLQKHCACHEKVEPRHTKSCNCHAKWSLQSNTSVAWNLQPSHGFSVGCFKHRHHKARNPCACHAKRIVSDPLQIHHACQRFRNPHELLRLPRILQRVEIPAPATRNTLSTSKNVPSTWRFNDFDFRIALSRRRGGHFEDQLPKVLQHRQLLTILTSESLSRAGVVQIFATSWAADPSHHLAFRTYLCEPSQPRNYGKTQHFAQVLPAKTSLLSHIDAARATGNFQYSRKFRTSKLPLTNLYLYIILLYIIFYIYIIRFDWKLLKLATFLVTWPPSLWRIFLQTLYYHKALEKIWHPGVWHWKIVFLCFFHRHILTRFLATSPVFVVYVQLHQLHQLHQWSLARWLALVEDQDGQLHQSHPAADEWSQPLPLGAHPEQWHQPCCSWTGM